MTLHCREDSALNACLLTSGNRPKLKNHNQNRTKQNRNPFQSVSSVPTPSNQALLGPQCGFSRLTLCPPPSFPGLRLSLDPCHSDRENNITLGRGELDFRALRRSRLTAGQEFPSETDQGKSWKSWRGDEGNLGAEEKRGTSKLSKVIEKGTRSALQSW